MSDATAPDLATLQHSRIVPLNLARAYEIRPPRSFWKRAVRDGGQAALLTLLEQQHGPPALWLNAWNDRGSLPALSAFPWEAAELGRLVDESDARAGVVSWYDDAEWRVCFASAAVAGCDGPVGSER